MNVEARGWVTHVPFSCLRHLLQGINGLPAASLEQAQEDAGQGVRGALGSVVQGMI